MRSLCRNPFSPGWKKNYLILECSDYSQTVSECSLPPYIIKSMMNGGEAEFWMGYIRLSVGRCKQLGFVGRKQETEIMEYVWTMKNKGFHENRQPSCDSSHLGACLENLQKNTPEILKVRVQCSGTLGNFNYQCKNQKWKLFNVSAIMYTFEKQGHSTAVVCLELEEKGDSLCLSLEQYYPFSESVTCVWAAGLLMKPG